MISEFEVLPLTINTFAKCSLDSNILLYLQKKADEIINDNFYGLTPYNYNLAGNIKKEFFFQEEENILRQAVILAAEKYCFDFYKKNIKLKFLPDDKGRDSIWINFQQKHEYNPIHNHFGLLSFVVWVKIPFSMKEEEEYFSSSHCNNITSAKFIFHLPENIPGGIFSFPISIDKNYEGKMIIFPASYIHEVAPFFTSDNYRVSISGNIIPADEREANLFRSVNDLKFKY